MQAFSEGEGDSPAVGARHACTGVRALTRGAIVPAVIAAGLVVVCPEARSAGIHGHRSAAAGRPTSSAPKHQPPPGAKAERAVQFALAQLGKPYVWGGNGPRGYDCSGLTSQAWRAAGVSIPRRSQDQARVGVGVPLGQARPGDLVVFYRDHSHVGLYIGGGKVVVSSHPGAAIRLMPMEWIPVSAVRRVG